MIAPLRRRLSVWIATRTPRVAGPWRIDRRRVYIVPTRYGYGFALLLFVMLLGAMNYSNSMAFALTFLLAGIGLLAMHDTHANLVNLSVSGGTPTPVFAGDVLRWPLQLRNAARGDRHGIRAAWQGAAAAAGIDIAADEAGELVLRLPTARRGWLPMPRFAVETEFPLGLFIAWSWIELDIAALVYPVPSEAGPPPPASGGGDGQQSGTQPGSDEFSGLRGYQAGDPLRAIDWKGLARQPAGVATPLVKQFAEAVDETCWLDWDRLPAGWDTERRLSQLTRWVIDADAAGRAYGLRLPGIQHPAAHGEAHRHACLRALALHE